MKKPEPLKILAAGYGKFDGMPADEDNPATKIASAFANRKLEQSGKYLPEVLGYQAIIPVVWDKAWPAIREAALKHDVDAIICIGQAHYTAFERMGRNEARGKDAENHEFEGCTAMLGSTEMVSLQDKDSRERSKTEPKYEEDGGKPIIKGAPYLMPTRLPFDFLEQQMLNSKNSLVLKPNKRSFDAGGYLCNFAAYNVVYHLQDKVPYCGFLHVEGGYLDEYYQATGEFLFDQFAEWLRTNYIREPRNKKTSNEGGAYTADEEASVC